jgi:WD40 repeat protein
MSVVHWTKDGNYVYLRPFFCCADAPEYVFFNYFNKTLALYRLDLRNGKLTATLQPFTDNVLAGYDVSFSPADKYLVYVASNNPRDVHIYNLQTGDIFTIMIDDQYDASGNLEWSQDGNKAIFMAAKSGWGSETPISNGISYFLLDLKTRSSLHLFDQQDMYRVNWTQDGNIILHEASGENGLLYDFHHNGFKIVTPTPQP